MKTPNPTMRDVARRAKVSTSTVSLALRQSPIVAEETRARVRQVAEALGYRMHPLVAAHMRSRRKPQGRATAPVLALVDTQRQRDGWRDNRSTVVRQMHAGAKARAEARGFEVREFWLHEPGLSHARFSAMLHARGIHGILLGPSSDLRLELSLAWDWFSVVRLGSASVSPSLHRVVNDHFQAATLLARELHALGYRRPLLVVRDALSACHDRRWEAGLRIACDYLRPIRLRPTLLAPEQPDARTLLGWIERHRPDVVIDAEERSMLELLRAAGRRVPEDLGVASFGTPAAGDAISGCVQDGWTMGAAAADLLITLLERNETGVPAVPATLSTNATWNPGQTLRRAPG